MKWLDEYEEKLKAATTSNGTIHDQIVAQIEFENLSPEMLGAIAEYWNGSAESAVDACEFAGDEVEETLIKLQSGEFGEGEYGDA